MAADGFGAPARLARLLVAGDAMLRAPDLCAALERRVANDAMLRDALQGRPWRDDLPRVLGCWHQALSAHLSALPPAWAHGDFHASNLFWRDGSVSAVLDFGLCNRASATFDLATAIERNAIAWLRLAPGCTDIGHPDLAAALLGGYDSARIRSPAERQALRPMLPLVHVDLALSELAYFHTVTGSAANAEAAYTDFLLGHATWFASDHGRQLLAAL